MRCARTGGRRALQAIRSAWWWRSVLAVGRGRSSRNTVFAGPWTTAAWSHPWQGPARQAGGYCTGDNRRASTRNLRRQEGPWLAGDSDAMTPPGWPGTESSARCRLSLVHHEAWRQIEPSWQEGLSKSNERGLGCPRHSWWRMFSWPYLVRGLKSTGGVVPPACPCGAPVAEVEQSWASSLACSRTVGWQTCTQDVDHSPVREDQGETARVSKIGKLCLGNSSVVKIYIIRPKPGPVAGKAFRLGIEPASSGLLKQCSTTELLSNLGASSVYIY